MTPDRAAITALQAALDAHPGLDHEGVATLAVTTLQGLGWRPITYQPLPPNPFGDFATVLDYISGAIPGTTQALLDVTPPQARFEQAIAEGRPATMWLPPGGRIDYDGSEQPWRPKLGENTIRPSWWRRIDHVTAIGLTACSIGIAAGLTLIGYLATR